MKGEMEVEVVSMKALDAQVEKRMRERRAAITSDAAGTQMALFAPNEHRGCDEPAVFPCD